MYCTIFSILSSHLIPYHSHLLPTRPKTHIPVLPWTITYIYHNSPLPHPPPPHFRQTQTRPTQHTHLTYWTHTCIQPRHTYYTHQWWATHLVYHLFIQSCDYFLHSFIPAYRTPYATFVRNCNTYCSWRWACKPETCRAEGTQSKWMLIPSSSESFISNTHICRWRHNIW